MKTRHELSITPVMHHLGAEELSPRGLGTNHTMAKARRGGQHAVASLAELR